MDRNASLPSNRRTKTGMVANKSGERMGRTKTIEESRWSRFKRRCRALSDNWKWNVLTTTLTIYALFGDDFRLAMTHKTMDNFFNSLTMLSTLVFAVDIVLSSCGQAEYFMGFFFYLDVGSTATLVLDLTWIGNALFCAGEDSSALRTSRAGRAGARASRTVRIIRLMRLVKLYKAYKTSAEKKKAEAAAREKAEAENPHPTPMRGSQVSFPPGEDPEGGEWVVDDGREDSEDPEDGRVRGSMQRAQSAFLDDDHINPRKSSADADVDASDVPMTSETRVGKKLSDMTTRRVIVLVLVMLSVMPQFSPSSSGWEEFPYSSTYGAEIIYERWRSYCGGNVSLAPTSAEFGSHLLCLGDLAAAHATDRQKAARAWFERALGNFIYYHHQGSFSYKLFWFGVSSKMMATPSDADSDARKVKAQAFLGALMPFNQDRFLGNYSYDSMSDWRKQFIGNGKWDEVVEPLSDVVVERLHQPWTEICTDFVGMPMQDTPAALTATDCSTNVELRCSEREIYAPMSLSDDEGREMSFLFTFDERRTTKLEAGLNILQTIFICFAVGLGAMSFSKNANELLLHPIERMIAKMETIKDNPLEAMRLGDLEYRREEVEAARKKDALAKMSRLGRIFFHYQYTKKVKEPMETVMLEKTIIKLGGLLALGFGEAGAEIAGRFASGGTGIRENSLGTVVDCAFGFAAIRHFNPIMKVLKEKTMVFVNQVSEVVHGCTDDWCGAPSKNLGDNFMLVWRLSGMSPERQTKLADMAVMAFVKIVAEINKSRVLAQYRWHPGLLQHIKQYRVTMGFGLHVGWAVEGAIGSEYKIDATYVSPNVHVAHRLQTCTTNYGIDIVMSDSTVAYCSKEMMSNCRLIDHVTVKGSRVPIRLFTMDLEGTAVDVLLQAREAASRNRFKIRQLREVRKNEKWSDDVFIADVLADDDDVKNMRNKYTKEFFHRFSMGYRNYEAGEWLAARDMFFTCHYQPRPDIGRQPVTHEDQWPVDGPVRMLLGFMQQYNYEPPPDWPGHRELPLEPRVAVGTSELSLAPLKPSR